jgi:hypothetical protein
MPNFVELKKMVQKIHADFGRPISSREAHSITRSALMSQFAEQFSKAAERYFRDVSDETGELATDNVLLQFLIKHGSIKGPMAVTA